MFLEEFHDFVFFERFSTYRIWGVSVFLAVLSSLRDFVEQAPFQATMQEMWQLPVELRHEFVELVLLDDAQLKRRGVDVPDGMELKFNARGLLMSARHFSV